VILTSSAQNKGIDQLWSLLTEFQSAMVENDQFYEKRKKQLALWFWTHLRENLLEILLSKAGMKTKLDILENDVMQGRITPGQASDILIEEFNELVTKNKL
jgi:LAO/AO transport system kinase